MCGRQSEITTGTGAILTRFHKTVKGYHLCEQHPLLNLEFIFVLCKIFLNCTPFKAANQKILQYAYVQLPLQHSNQVQETALWQSVMCGGEVRKRPLLAGKMKPNQLQVPTYFRYARLLAPSEQYDRKRGLYTGIATGFNWVLTYSLNSIGLAYGTRLVMNDMAKPTEERDYQVGEIVTVSTQPLVSLNVEFIVHVQVHIQVKRSSV